MKCLLLALMITCSSAFAENQLFIFFINGINTTPDEAEFNLSKIEQLVDTDNQSITWNVLYNATHGVIRSDVWDVIAQKHEERLQLDYAAYRKQYPTHSLNDYLSDRKYVGKNLQEIVQQFHNKMPQYSGDVYVLIISHSQGNQYANQLFDYLVNAEGFPCDHIALIGIATPASVGAGQSFYYVTANNDKIINTVRIFPMPPLPANTHIEKCYDISCHNLVNDYLGDSKIRSMICKHIGSFMNLWLNTQPMC